MHNYKKGFTLAEMMVVIGLLGVLGAVLIPSVMRKTPDRNKMMFKKTYSELQGVISTLLNDDVEYPSDQTALVGTINYPRGFNNTNAGTNGTTNKFCYLLRDSMNTVGDSFCPANNIATDAAGPTGRGFFTTNDGIFWNVYTTIADSINFAITSTSTGADTATYQFPVSPTLYTTKIIIDVNGVDKGDNCSTDTNAGNYRFITSTTVHAALTRCTYYTTCDKTPDRFIIGVRYDGKLLVGDTATSDTCAVNVLKSPLGNTVEH